MGREERNQYYHAGTVESHRMPRCFHAVAARLRSLGQVAAIPPINPSPGHKPAIRNRDCIFRRRNCLSASADTSSKPDVLLLQTSRSQRAQDVSSTSFPLKNSLGFLHKRPQITIRFIVMDSSTPPSDERQSADIRKLHRKVRS